MWLLNRLFNKGDQSTPRFAFQGTVNWMRALAILCESKEFSIKELKIFYKGVKRKPGNVEADTISFEFILMAMHNVSSLNHLSSIEKPYECVRSSIIAWYYSVYYASKAMIAVATGANPQTHAKTGRIWQTETVVKGLVQRPFHLSVTDLTPNNIKTVINGLRGSNMHYLNTEPKDSDMAWGAVYSYLKGTADYEKLRIEEQVRNSPEFKRGGYSNFRKKDAKLLRDKKLTHATVNFLVQAFRYRGKANYRDVIYLSYGSDYTDTLRQFTKDLAEVAGAFVLMAAYYVSIRVKKDAWSEFVKDIIEYAQFELPFEPDKI